MTRARNRLLSKSEYKGKEVDVVDRTCPCRECFSTHDCGYTNSRGRWVSIFRCLTNHNRGCPQPLPVPIHILRTSGGRTCARCGISLSKEEKAQAEMLRE